MDTPDNPEYDEILAAVVRKEAHTPPEDERGVLFTVTTIARSEKFGGSRTPVICLTFDRARQIVEENEGDIWEYSYMLCVIEAVLPDVLYSAAGGPQYWYAWDLKQEKYLPIEIPEAYENTFGYGIG